MKPATYAIQSWLGGPVKVGKADDVESRLSELQTGSPLPLRIMASTRSISEPEAHKQCAGDRIWGEWFFPSASLATYVNQWECSYEPISHMDECDGKWSERWFFPNPNWRVSLGLPNPNPSHPIFEGCDL